jgi:phosphopantetheinyl transferase
LQESSVVVNLEPQSTLRTQCSAKNPRNPGYVVSSVVQILYKLTNTESSKICNLNSKICIVPVFFQHRINETTRLGIWKIEEAEGFFRDNVPQHRDVTHPRKRLQHLAGRFLLRFLFPDFPYELIQIADTRKPFLENDQYHFSISHCGDYAAAIVSSDSRVGIDIEIPVEKIDRISDKFLTAGEKSIFRKKLPEASEINALNSANDLLFTTIFWSAKESVFKWYGDGGVDFRKDIQLKKLMKLEERIDCFFTKTGQDLSIEYRSFENLALAWVVGGKEASGEGRVGSRK